MSPKLSIPLVLSLDHCGPMTRTVADAALMLQALAGYDRLDIASVEHPAEDYVAALDRLKRQMRLNLYNFFRLLPMNRGQALDAVAKTGGPLVDARAAAAVVQFLARRAGEAERGDRGALTEDLKDGEVDPAFAFDPEH